MFQFVGIEDATKIEFVLPTETRIFGRYVGEFKSGSFKQAIEIPDGRNVVAIYSRGDPTLLLMNSNNANFSINFTTFNNDANETIIGRMKYDGEEQHVLINDEWTISPTLIENTLQNRLVDGLANPFQSNDNLLLKIALDKNHFEQLGPNVILANVRMRLNDGSWVKFGFTREKLSYIAFAQQ